jgi:lia operon protein LiaF
MFQRLPTDTLNIIIVISVFLLILEVVFFNGYLIFSVLFSGALIYVGWNNFGRTWAKILFFIGAISLFFTVLNMMAVRFLIIAGLILFFVHYQRLKKEPEKYTPSFAHHDEQEKEPLMNIKPLFQNRLFGDQYTRRTAYAWADVNIHSGFGDRILDLSNTVLPEQADISIRHLIGNIVIYVPYEVEVAIHHSSLFGRADILGEEHVKLLNGALSYRTKDYDANSPRVKIVTSILSGDIEVKRI